jgi:hypothetical protein
VAKKKPQKVKKLAIKRDPEKAYRVRGGDIQVSVTNREVHGDGNVIALPAGDDNYELLVATGITQEPGWIYFLDGDGDLARLPI